MATAAGRAISWERITQDTDLGNILLELVPPQPVSGNIRDPEGNPIPHAAITVVKMDRSKGPRLNMCPLDNPQLGDIGRISCGEDGSFEYEYLAPATSLQLLLAPEGYVTTYGWLAIREEGYIWQQPHGDPSAEPPFSGWLMKPVKPEELSIRLPRGAAVTGRVFLPGGEDPAQDVGVFIVAGPADESSAARTDADGSYRLDGLPPGTKRVFMEAEGLVAPASEELELRPGESFEGIDFELTEGGCVTGRVLDTLTGRPVPEVSVAGTSPARPAPWPFHFATTDEHGVYRLQVAPGEATVWVRYAPSGYAWQPQRPGRERGKQTVQVAEGETVGDIDFEIEPEAVISGVVVDFEGKPVANALLVYSLYPEMEPAQTGADGAFRITGASPGTDMGVLARQEDPPRAAFVSVTAPEAGEEPVDIRIELSACVRIEGKVEDTNGDPIPDAKVRVRIRMPGMTYPLGEPVTTDEEGAFEFDGAVLAAVHQVTAVAEGYVSTRHPSLRAALAEVLAPGRVVLKLDKAGEHP